MYLKDNHTPPHLITDNSITIVWDGESYVVPSSSPNYKVLREYILNCDWDAIEGALDNNQTLANISEGRITVKDNTVHYDDEPIENAATQKLLDLLQDGLSDPKPWMRFIEKLMANPSYNSRNQLYKFLEHQNMPITEDGNIVGYKGVTNEYRDIYSNTFDNSVGQTLEMPRTNVDDSVDHGCSAGFHIGSHEYADNWGHNGKLMQVEFSPTDAVSVPHCSSYAKLRVCKYKVIGECHQRQKLSDGLYQNGHDDNRHKKIYKHLRKRWKKGKSTRFHKLSSKFPGLSWDELYRACERTGCDITVNWDDITNDYLIN